MLTDKEKKHFNYQWLLEAAFFRCSPFKPTPPKIGCIYAAEMSDDTVKIGVSKNIDRRINEIQRQVYPDVKRVHHTDYAPFDFMTKLELRCHAAFADRRIRGEFFDITFEEAVAELDSHADEVAAVHAAADERLLDKIDYFFNEFLPEYKEMYCEQVTENVPQSTSSVEKVRFSLTACVYALLMSNDTVYIDYADIRHRFTKIEQESGLTVKDVYFTFSMSQETAHLIAWTCQKNFSSFRTEGEFFKADFSEVINFLKSLVEIELERNDRLLKIADMMDSSPERQSLLIQAANFYVGKILP